jgi:hypothetical protein
MRKVKAEGGWAVVSTEQVEIHPTSDITPFIELRIWDDTDLPALSLIAAAIHDGGALAGIELCHNGMNSPNLYSRETPLGPHHLPVASYGCDPVQARMMSKQDIADLRRWHRNAVVRSMRAGYDLVYVYAGHSFGGGSWLSARGHPGLRRRGPWGCGATTLYSRRPRATLAAALPGSRGCPACPLGRVCWTTASRRSGGCPTSRSTARAG